MSPVRYDAARRRRLRHTFDADAEGYHRGRPGYPDELFDLLEAEGALRSGARVVEVGPGSGLATAELVARGAIVTAVEPGSELAAVLAQSLPDVDIRVADFEQAELPSASFDLVAAATSFHWIEAAAGLARAADLLRPGGMVALWWTTFNDIRADQSFHLATRKVWEAAGEPAGAHVPHGLDEEARRAELAADGNFDAPLVRHLAWTVEADRAAVRALYATFSTVRGLTPEDRHGLLDGLARVVDDEFDGHVSIPAATSLYLARRR